MLLTVDLDGGLGGVGQSSLGTLACGSETTHGTAVIRDVKLGLALELLLEVLEESSVEVRTSKMLQSVSADCPHCCAFSFAK